MAAHFLIEFDCGFNRSFDFGINAFAIVFSRDADLESGQARFDSANIVADWCVARGSIVRVSSGNDGEHPANVLGSIGERTDLIQRGSESNQAIAGNSAVSRFEPDNSAKACRLAYRAARVG